VAPAPRRLETVEGREVGQSLRDREADGLLEYSQKFRSDLGKKNGLYPDTGMFFLAFNFNWMF
jgi:hypothetical protein